MKLRILYEDIKYELNLKKWFGSSKVTDSGKPKIVYHGTVSDNIKVFDPDKISSNSGNAGHYGYGFYFSEDISEAKTYGSNILKVYLKITTPFRGTNEELRILKQEGFGNIEDEEIKSIDFTSLKTEISKIDKKYAEFLGLLKKNKSSSTAFKQFRDKYGDIDIDLNDIYDVYQYTELNDPDGVPEHIFELLRDIGIDVDNIKTISDFPHEQSLHWVTDLGNSAKDFTNLIKKLGYDGVIYGSEYVVFEPTQIKSVENDGSFDSNDPNIYS
jgi:hypothetical protein